MPKTKLTYIISASAAAILLAGSALQPAEAQQHKQLVEGAVLAGWAKRCGRECAAEWNNTVGKTLGLTAPTN